MAFYKVLKKWNSLLAKPIDQWPDDEGYNTTHRVVKTLKVVNDVAERSIKLIQIYCGRITQDDAERDDLFQSVEPHRKTKVMTREDKSH